MTETTGGVYDLKGMAKYRYERYMQSRSENPNFYFGPFSLLLYGASAFVYGSFPSTKRNFVPDYDTISSFFGAAANGDGTYRFTGQEKIPDDWYNRADGMLFEVFSMSLGRHAHTKFSLHRFQNWVPDLSTVSDVPCGVRWECR